MNNYIYILEKHIKELKHDVGVLKSAAKINYEFYKNISELNFAIKILELLKKDYEKIENN